jgi:uncharacterized protein YndB with AHSA1/START domain
MKVIDSPVGVARLVGEVAAVPADVYRYFTDADLLEQWWPEEAAIDERSGLFELSWPGQGMRLLCQYLVRESGRRLAFTWAFAHEPFPARTVDVHFEPSDLGTRLTIEHTHGDDADERQGYIDGWKYFIERLRGVLPAD